MLRILYAGSPAASAKTLDLLFGSSAAGGSSDIGDTVTSNSNFQIVGVLTNPPRSHGRHKTLIPTPVQEMAEKHGVKVFTPEKLDAEARAAISEVNADLLVCFAYGKIFGPKFMSLFKYGGINLHPSLLPRYRGATPIPAAIFNRDAETAVTVQTLAEKMDEGDILAQEKISLDFTETAGWLLDRSAEIGAGLLAEVISETEKNNALPAGLKQTGEASYTTVLTKESGHIDWSRSAAEIDAQIRACTPEPCAWTSDNIGVIKILKARVADKQLEVGAALADDTAAATSSESGTVVAFEKNMGIFVATGNGTLIIEQLQRQGKNAMAAKEFMNGARNFLGSKLI